MTEPILIAGTHSAATLPAVARELGPTLSPAIVQRFPDGEIHVEVGAHLGRRDVFLLQSLTSPVGDAALEALLIADAAWRSGAMRVSLLVPYFAYARQDRRTAEGEALGAKVLARVIEGGRFTHVAIVDLHSAAVAAAFEAPIEHITALPLIVEALRPQLAADAVIVSPDLGAVKLAERYARALALPLAVVHKVRLSPREVATQGVVGDVVGKQPVIVDDMISTGATIVAAIEALRQNGCVRPAVIAATHGLLVDGALERIRMFQPERVIVTDSISCRAAAEVPAEGDPGALLQVVELAPLLARTIRALHRRETVAELLSHV